MNGEIVPDGTPVHFCYVDCKGVVREITAFVGMTLMQVAQEHQIQGIDGDCRGKGVCGTCRIRLDDRAAERAGPPSGPERELLEFISTPKGHFRLGCQMRVSTQLSGAVIEVATELAMSGAV
jgi:2Fe-2S ferredoxin